MCDEPDYYYMTMDERRQKARKVHVCYACREQIRVGDAYQVSRCISTSRYTPFEWYKHCLRCAAMLDAIVKARPEDSIAWDLACGEDWRDTIGELPDEVAALAFMTPDDAQKTLAGAT